MKATFQLRHLLILFCCGCVFLMSGCRQEGCTDKAALNYSSVASKDDGSCVYCEKTKSENEFDLNIIDWNFSSEYYGQTVARVHLHHMEEGYQFDDCGDGECKIYFDVENLRNRGMSFYYYLSFSSFTSFSYSIYLPAYETTTPDSIVSSGTFSDVCNVHEGSTQVYLNSDITYF